eukprot:11108814-Lingulodinium_polyedra.AAC.1
MVRSSAASTASGSSTATRSSPLPASPLLCRACDRPKESKSPYCVVHKRAFQNLYYRAHKKDKKTGQWFFPQEQEDFHKVFGTDKDGPPNEQVANQ